MVLSTVRRQEGFPFRVGVRVDVVGDPASPEPLTRRAGPSFRSQHGRSRSWECGKLHGGSLPSRPTVRSNFSSLVCCPVHHNTQHTTTLNLQDSRIDRPRVFLSRCVDEDHRDQNVVNTVDSEDMVVGATQLDEGDSFLVVSNDAAPRGKTVGVGQFKESICKLQSGRWGCHDMTRRVSELDTETEHWPLERSQ